ncbi:MAG: hypothetical protein PHQ19_07800 [Candidatus Krumholzibacteria bacterium]|nr:hypothetical protein [Candidatus Krumholzibacteria bacterium]
MSDLLIGIALAAVIWGVVSAIAMVSFVSGRGHRINWLLIRLLIFTYMNQYQEITRQENGKTGRWFYSYIVAMNVALVCAVIGAILR